MELFKAKNMVWGLGTSGIHCRGCYHLGLLEAEVLSVRCTDANWLREHVVEVMKEDGRPHFDVAEFVESFASHRTAKTRSTLAPQILYWPTIEFTDEICAFAKDAWDNEFHYDQCGLRRDCETCEQILRKERLVQVEADAAASLYYRVLYDDDREPGLTLVCRHAKGTLMAPLELGIVDLTEDGRQLSWQDSEISRLEFDSDRVRSAARIAMQRRRPWSSARVTIRAITEILPHQAEWVLL